MKVILELQDQPANVRRVVVRHDIVIGRGSDCNLRLSAPQVSRRHCFLRVGREGVSITDLDSSNGTYVDGKRIKSGKRYDLTDGSSLSLGPIRFVIHIREKVVSENVLKAGDLSESGQLAAGKQASDQSTVLAHSSAVATDDSNPPSSRLDISIEQAGEAAEANESTSRNLGTGTQADAELRKARRSQPEQMDSRAEILDLGRLTDGINDHDFAAGQSIETPSAEAMKRNPLFTDKTAITGDADIVELADESGDHPDDMSIFATGDDAGEAAAISESVEPQQFSNAEIGDVVEEIVEVPDDDVLISEVTDISDQQAAIPGTNNSFEAASSADPEVIEVTDIEEWVDEEPIPDHEVHDYPEAESVVEVEVVDDVEELEVEDLLLTDDMTGFVEVEKIPDEEPEAVVVTEDDQIETSPEIPETGGDGNWFGDVAADDDEIDPNLNSFLKGF